MTTLETSIHVGYQPEWSIQEALRELLSNALDGETKLREYGYGKAVLNYDESKKEVVITNVGVTVPTRALLMGTSESREDSRTIGQFGEGLPMALLVLARERLPVIIYNGSERWTPAIEFSSTYQADILAIKTRKVQDRGRFEIRVSGVTLDTWTKVQRLFLRFDPALKMSDVITLDEGERILLQPEFCGRIYCKGVFVLEREDLLFGYEINGKLNRDRSFMDEWDLKNRIGSMLSQASVVSTFRASLISLLFKSPAVLECRTGYSDLVFNHEVCTEAVEVFKSRYGQEAVPVLYDYEEVEAEELGLTPVHVGETLHKILSYSIATLAKRREERDQRPVNIWSVDDLNTDEQRVFLTIRALIMAVFNIGTSAVTFANEATVTSFNPPASLFISRENLDDFNAVLVSAVNEITRKRQPREEPAIWLARMIKALTLDNPTGLTLDLIGRP